MKYRNIDRNVRSTVTVTNIYGHNYIWRKCRVEVTSVGLAHARPISIISAELVAGAWTGSWQCVHIEIKQFDVYRNVYIYNSILISVTPSI